MPERIHACFAALLVALAAAGPAAAQDPGPSRGARQQVYAYTLKHQQADAALVLVRPLLTAGGAVEVQPGGNTLVIRDAREVVNRIARLLAAFDHPPEELRYEIQIVRAGPEAQGVSPPRPQARPDDRLSEELVAQLRRRLRYDDYRVLAEVGVSSRQGEDVTYELGQTYSVSFRSGPVLGGRRVKLEDFRIVKQAQQVSDKGRRLEPRELFHATLNLWIGQPFNLVLAHDESRQEALMVKISCRRESGDAGSERRGAEAAKPPAQGSPTPPPQGSAPLKRPAEGRR